MSYDLPNEEEAVNHMNFFPQRYFLQSKQSRQKEVQRGLRLSTKQSLGNGDFCITLFLMISIHIFLKRLAGPQDQRCC